MLRNMKYKVSIVVIFAMLFCAASAIAAVQEDFLFTQVQSGAQNDIYLDSMAAFGDAMYLHDYNNGCVWRTDLDTKEIASFPDTSVREDETYDTIDALASRSDRLYALASSYKREPSGVAYLGSGLYELLPGEAAFDQKLICELDLSAYVGTIEGWGEELSSSTMVLRENALYCLFHNNGVLVKISLIDQSIRDIDVEEPIYMAEYGSDQLVISCQEPDGTQRIVAYDPAEDELSTLVTGVYPSVSGFLYREADHMLYAVSEGSVYRIDPRVEHSKAKKCGTLSTYDTMIGGADVNGQLIWYSDSEALAVSFDAKKQETRTLSYSVIGAFSSETLEGFARAQGNLYMKNVPRTEPEIIDDMLTRSDAVDVYIINITEAGIYRSLYQRGYLKPLDREAIREKIGEMYPFIRDMATQNGAAVALPISMVLPINQLGIDRELCTRLGLDVPDNWSAFLDILEAGLAQTDAYLFSQQDAQMLERGLFSLLMSAYSAAMNSGAGPSSYHTPELVSLLQRLQTLDYEGLIQSAAPDVEDNANILFALDIPDSCRVPISKYEPLPLGISKGQCAYVYASVTLMCINPYSKDQELALDFLEYTLKNLSPLAGAQLFETATAPIEDPDYADLKQEYEEQLARYEAAIEAADNIEQTALREELANYIEANEQMLADTQYIVTQESLNAFRARLDTYVPYYNEGLNEDASDRLSTANARYFEGSLSIEQYLDELDRQITMRAMEDVR